MDHDRSNSGKIFAKALNPKGLKIAGHGASAVKYDVLTALLALAAQDESPKARLALRLSLVITARYNWRSGAFNVGLRELARMWGVTERTAKREMSLMRSLGWIAVVRVAVRGRVAQHRIEFATILRDTIPYWSAIGTDFEERMTGVQSPPPSNVVPFQSSDLTVPAQDGSVWPDVAAELMAEDAAIYAAWFAQLTVLDVEAGVMTLCAPSKFVAGYIQAHYRARLLAAVARKDRSLRDLQIVAADQR